MPFGVCAHTMRSGGNLWLSGMLRMVWSSCGGKISLMKPILHCLVSWSINEVTRELVGSAYGWEVIRKVVLMGSHLSVHTEIESPFPTCQRYPCWIIFWTVTKYKRVMILKCQWGSRKVSVRKSYYKKRGLSQRFQNCWDSPRKHWNRVKIPILVFFFFRCFKPLCNECGYRVVGPVPTLFKSTGKGIRFESAGIGLLNYINSRPILTLLKALI